MLDRRADDSAPGRLGARHAANREVVRLGAAAGEDDLARGRSDEPRDLRASLLQCTAGALAASMDRGGICLVHLDEAGDGGAHLGPQWRAGVMVEINAHTSLIGPRRTNNLA